MTRVLLVDDQGMIRAGLRTLLEGAGVTVSGEAANGEEALRAIRRDHPDVVLMDLRMPLMGGVEAVRAIRADPELSSVRILVLTTFDGDREVLAALSAGADGFLGKAAEPEELLAAVEAAARGEATLSARASRAVVDHLAASAPPPVDADLERRIADLTPRERDVVAAAAAGHDSAEIGRMLFISPYTVKTHLNRAMAKLGVKDRGQLVALAYRGGIARR